MRTKFKVLMLSLLFVVSCSAVDAALSVVRPSPGLSVNTDLQSGDRSYGTNENTDISDNEGTIITNASDNQFNNPSRVVINEVSTLTLALLILGWVLPTPVEIWKGFKDFILRLLKR